MAHNFGFRVGTFTHYLGVNQFADYTSKELDKVYMRQGESSISPGEEENGEAIKNKIDSNGQEDRFRKMKKSCRGDNLTEKNNLVQDTPQDDELQMGGFSSSPVDSMTEESEGELQNRLSNVSKSEKDSKILDDGQADKQPHEGEKCIKREHTVTGLNDPIDLIDQASDYGNDENCHQDESCDEEIHLSELLVKTDKTNVKDDLFEPTNAEKDNKNSNDELQVDSSPLIVQDENNQVYLDWRDSGCLFIPRDQGLCSSCYAFVSITLSELWHCKQTGKLIPFSEQYMVDCGKHVDMAGCSGGNMPRAGRFIMDWGVELREKYPYSGKDSSCPYESDDWERAGYKRPIINKYTKAHQLKKWPELLEKSGPILVQLRLPQDFHFYAGKVHKGDNCNVSADGFFHLMLVIGHGKEDGQDYWLLRNSHGPNWGERGYFKLSKKCNIDCFFLAKEAQVDFSTESVYSYETFNGINGTKLRPSEALLKGLTGKDLREFDVYDVGS